MYIYNMEVLKVVDGDTLHAKVDLGFDTRVDITLRLAHVNAPEHGTPEGDAATQFVKDWIEANPTFTLQTIKDKREKFGRYLAVMSPSEGGETLNDALVRTGNAVPYEGGKR